MLKMFGGKKMKNKLFWVIPLALIAGWTIGQFIIVVLVEPPLNYFNDKQCTNQFLEDVSNLRSNITLPMSPDEAFFYLQSRDTYLMSYVLCLN